MFCPGCGLNLEKAAQAPAAAPPRRRRRAALPALALLVLVAAVGGLVLATRRDAKPAAERPTRKEETRIVPGRSIGPVALGDSPAEVRNALGEPGAAGGTEWDVLGGQIIVTFEDAAVTGVTTDSPRYKVDGVSGETPFGKAAAALPEWDATRCPDEGGAELRIVSTGDPTITTLIQYPPGPGSDRADVEIVTGTLNPACYGE